MFTSLKIEGYRGFDRFEMSGLGRINLLVGTNNSGKTSVLEALYLLASAGSPAALFQLLRRRGERLPPAPSSDMPPRRSPGDLDVSHLFLGHELQPGASISITASNEWRHRNIVYRIAELSPKQQQEFLGDEDESALTPRLALEVKGTPKPVIALVPLTRLGGISTDAIDSPVRRVRQRGGELFPAQFITAEGMSGDELVAMWNNIALTPEEELVLNALQFLDKDVERIAAHGAYYLPQTRGGFIVKRAGSEQPVPLGSMGDGMWRMLAMAMAVTQCKGGVLLVDEIDTGLHYTVMSRMWGLIFDAAKQLDVQVFATTHSYDCVYSLAQICSGSEVPNAVTVQRIEAGKRHAIPYDEGEITVAASREIEVR